MMLYQFHIKGGIILYSIHISGTRMIEDVIDGLSKMKNLVGIMRGLNYLQFVPMGQGMVEISTGL